MGIIAIVAVVGGALAGAGLYLIARQLTPGPPALGPALRGLNAPAAEAGITSEGSGLVAAVAARITVPHRDLALIGYTVERFVTEKILYTLVGLIFPGLFGLLLAMTPLHLPIAIPALASVGLAALMFWLVDVSIRQKADDARKQFARRVGAYFSLVAQQLAKAKGPTEALESAASVGGGWVFDRIRAALETSRLRLEPPWDGLRAVADEIGVPELGEIGDIMTIAGAEGGQVYQTLRARAKAMHAAWITTEQERANRATTMLYIPTSLLVFVLFVIGAYPMLYRLITS